MKRVVIYPKDIMLITGKSERYAREILKKIKKQLNKPDNQYITIKEFCTYTGIDLLDISEVLK
jgi:hypothetical protein